MNAVVERVQPWSKARWTTTITIVLILHLAVVLAFSHRSRLQPRSGVKTQVILPEKVAEELRALTDPTLLALGGPRSFSAMWLETPRVPPVDARWKQTPQWFSLDSDTLGEHFLAFARSNAASLHGLAFKTTPEALPVARLARPKPLRTKSTMRVTGDLAHRRLLNPPDLPSWPATDLLPPSEIRVIVDVRGRVISAILQSSSECKEADQFAVKQAWRTRFSSVPDGTEAGSLALGQLVFEWRATRATNSEPEATSK